MVVIGSYRGFVPLVFGKALQDNQEQGEVVFIDPSLADDFWKDGDAVRRYFRGFGIGNVRHFRMTTQEFTGTETYRTLGQVGLVFIDGYHSEEHARADYEAFAPFLAPRGFVLFHDSMVVRPDRVYGNDRAYEMRVKYAVDALKTDPGLQVLDLPYGVSGLTIVRRREEGDEPRRTWFEGAP